MSRRSDEFIAFLFQLSLSLTKATAARNLRLTRSALTTTAGASFYCYYFSCSQVGTVKNTRFITVTSTFERSLVTPTESPDILPTEPLTENILATSTPAYDVINLDFVLTTK